MVEAHGKLYRTGVWQAGFKLEPHQRFPEPSHLSKRYLYWIWNIDCRSQAYYNYCDYNSNIIILQN